MTCIVGIEHMGSVWLGGDSAASEEGGTGIHRRTAPKVFRSGEFVIGYTSSFRIGQLLQYSFAPPAIPSNVDLMRYLVVDFVDAFRSVLRDKGCLETDDGSESGGTILVGIHGCLFTIEDDFNVGRTPYGYLAVGCGEDPALGALHATKHSRNPRHRILEALRAATEFCSAVRPPYTVINT